MSQPTLFTGVFDRWRGKSNVPSADLKQASKDDDQKDAKSRLNLSWLQWGTSEKTEGKAENEKEKEENAAVMKEQRDQHLYGEIELFPTWDNVIIRDKKSDEKKRQPWRLNLLDKANQQDVFAFGKKHVKPEEQAQPGPLSSWTRFKHKLLGPGGKQDEVVKENTKEAEWID